MKADSKHMNLKLLYTVVLIFIVFVVNLLRGGKRPSIIGNERCSTLDYFLFSSLIVVGLIGTVVSTKWANSDFKYKQSIDY